MKFLITGFMPFGGESVNPSWDAVAILPDKIEDRDIVKLRLPVSFNRAPQMVIDAIEREKPDAVICVGQAGGRACVNVERIAVNLANAKSPDTDGDRPVNRSVIPDAPDAYFSTLPIDRVVEAVRSAGIPCHPSNSAGLYVCNTLLYQLLHRFPGLPIGFIHLPYSTAQAVGKGKDTPSMSVCDMSVSLAAIVGSL